MNFAWASHPIWLIINALVAYRLTRLWIDDMLPPLPRIRWTIETRAFNQQERRERAAIDADMTDPEHLLAVDLAGKDAFRGGYNAQRVVGPREEAERQRLNRSGGQPNLAYLTQCYWCAGFWIALAVTLAASTLPAIAWAPIALPLALSATTGLIASTKGGK